MDENNKESQSFIHDFWDIALGDTKGEKALTGVVAGSLATAGGLAVAGFPTAAKVSLGVTVTGLLTRAGISIYKFVKKAKDGDAKVEPPKISSSEAISAGASISTAAKSDEAAGLAVMKEIAGEAGIPAGDFELLAAAYKKGLLTTAKQKTQWAMLAKLAESRVAS